MIISIAGGTGAGKSTIAKEISKYYHQTYHLNSVVISMDNYYKNIHFERFENYDHPDAFNTTLLYGDLLHYTQTKSIAIRKYDYESKESRYLETVYDVDLLIFEGLYAFYTPKINALCNLTLYLDIKEDIRIQRRVIRDKRERNISEEENMKMITGFVREMHSLYIEKQKQYAMLSFRNSDNIIHNLRAFYNPKA